MTVNITHELFRKGHQIFLNKIKADVNDFSIFEHNLYLQNQEFAYKWAALKSGRAELNLDKWQRWKNSPGKIISAVKKACHTKEVKELNLLYYATPKKWSGSALDEVKTAEKKRGLEEKLFELFLDNNIPIKSECVAERFDALESYFRMNRLSENWAFFSYLLFLVDGSRYFPFLPSYFEKLLEFYHIDEKLKDKSWKTYSVLLEVADDLKEKLLVYGNLDAIKIQSYMWVIAHEIHKRKLKSEDMVIKGSEDDYSSELKRRNNESSDRNIIGLRGELFVLEEEKKKLMQNGLEKLLSKIEHVAITRTDGGYDIKSFDLDQNEIHIEVKTKGSFESDVDYFYLTKNERDKAEEDKGRWHLYRVYDQDGDKKSKDLGNIVTDGNYDFEPISFRVALKKGD